MTIESREAQVRSTAEPMGYRVQVYGAGLAGRIYWVMTPAMDAIISFSGLEQLEEWAAAY